MQKCELGMRSLRSPTGLAEKKPLANEALNGENLCEASRLQNQIPWEATPIGLPNPVPNSILGEADLIEEETLWRASRTQNGASWDATLIWKKPLQEQDPVQSSIRCAAGLTEEETRSQNEAWEARLVQNERHQQWLDSARSARAIVQRTPPQDLGRCWRPFGARSVPTKDQIAEPGNPPKSSPATAAVAREPATAEDSAKSVAQEKAGRCWR
jgi:hypothetical protein